MDEHANQKILQDTNSWLIGRLLDGKAASIAAIGAFEAVVVKEYVHVHEGISTLHPPRVTLRFTPAPYLLRSDHYSSLEFASPSSYVGQEVIQCVAGLTEHTLPEVAQSIEGYLKKLLRALFRGKRVSLLELGDLFVSDDNAGHPMLNFVPNTGTLTLLNRPFEPYPSQQLRAGVDFPEIEHFFGSTPDDLAEQAQQTPLSAVSLPDPKASHTQDKTNEIPLEESELLQAENKDPKQALTPGKKKRKRTLRFFLIVFILHVIGFTAFFIYREAMHSPPTQVEEPTPAPVEQPTPKEEASAPKAPLDTVRVVEGTSLSRLARQYYNETDYWVYIYLANDSVISDPDNLQPGTTLVIPSLEGIDPEVDPSKLLLRR